VHIKEEVLDEEGRIDPVKLDAVARMGGDYYCRAQGDALFTVPKPLATKGIGVDQIPAPIRNSKILTGNDLGILGNVEKLPSKGSLDEVIEYAGINEVHMQAQKLIHEGKVESAWRLLLIYHHG
jgi:hypothetical protein